MDDSLKLCHNLAWRSLKTFKRINGFEDFRKWKVWRIFAGSTHCGGESYLIQLPDIFSPLSTHPSHCPQDLAGYFFRKSSKEYSQKKKFRIFQTETLEPLPVPSNPLPGFREFTQNKMLKLILFVTILFIEHRKCFFCFRLNEYGKENKERKRILEVRKQ